LACGNGAANLVITSDHNVLAKKRSGAASSSADLLPTKWCEWPARELRKFSHEVFTVSAAIGYERRQEVVSVVTPIHNMEAEVVQVELAGRNDAILVSAGGSDGFIAVFGEPTDDVAWVMVSKPGHGLSIVRNGGWPKNCMRRSASDSSLLYIEHDVQVREWSQPRAERYLPSLDTSSEGRSARLSSEYDASSLGTVSVRVGGLKPFHKARLAPQSHASSSGLVGDLGGMAPQHVAHQEPIADPMLELAISAVEQCLEITGLSSDWISDLATVLQEASKASHIGDILRAHGWSGNQFSEPPHPEWLHRDLKALKETAGSKATDSIALSRRLEPKERFVSLSSFLDLPLDKFGRRLNRRAIEAHSQVCGTVRFHCWYHQHPDSCKLGALCDWCHNEEHFSAKLKARRGKKKSAMQKGAIVAL